jgi:hypothetical protein
VTLTPAMGQRASSRKARYYGNNDGSAGGQVIIVPISAQGQGHTSKSSIKKSPSSVAAQHKKKNSRKLSTYDKYSNDIHNNNNNDDNNGRYNHHVVSSDNDFIDKNSNDVIRMARNDSVRARRESNIEEKTSTTFPVTSDAISSGANGNGFTGNSHGKLVAIGNSSRPRYRDRASPITTADSEEKPPVNHQQTFRQQQAAVTVHHVDTPDYNDNNIKTRFSTSNLDGGVNGYPNQLLQSNFRQQHQQQHQQHQQQHQQHQQQHQQQLQQQRSLTNKRSDYDNLSTLDSRYYASEPQGINGMTSGYEQQDIVNNRLRPSLRTDNNRQRLLAASAIQRQQSNGRPYSSLTLLSSNGGVNYDGVIDFSDDDVIDVVIDNHRPVMREREHLNKPQQHQTQARVGGRVYKSSSLLSAEPVNNNQHERFNNYSDFDLYKIELNTLADGVEQKRETPLGAGVGGGYTRRLTSEPPSSSSISTLHHVTSLPPSTYNAAVHNQSSSSSGFVSTVPSSPRSSLPTIRETDVTVQQQDEMLKMRKSLSGQHHQRPASFPLTLPNDRVDPFAHANNDEDVVTTVPLMTSSRRSSVTSSLLSSSPYVARAMCEGGVGVAQRRSPLPYQQQPQQHQHQQHQHQHQYPQQQHQQMLRNHRPPSVSSSQSPHSVRRLRFSDDQSQQQQRPLVSRSLTNLNCAAGNSNGASVNGMVPQVAVRASYDSTLLKAKPPLPVYDRNRGWAGGKPPIAPAPTKVRRSRSSVNHKETPILLLLTNKPSVGRSTSDDYNNCDNYSGSYAPVGLPSHLHHLRMHQLRHQQQQQGLPVSTSNARSPSNIARSTSHLSQASSIPRYHSDSLSVHSSNPVSCCYSNVVCDASIV